MRWHTRPPLETAERVETLECGAISLWQLISHLVDSSWSNPYRHVQLSPCGAMPSSWRRRCEADDHSDVMSPCWCEANDDSSVKLLYRIYYSLVDFPTIAGRQTIA